MIAPGDDYAGFAERLRATGLIHDPWLDGAPRFSSEPVWLSSSEHDALTAAAEEVAAVYDELVRLVARDAALEAAYFALGDAGRAMWWTSRPQWHGVARADVFLTDDGPRVCELNCDTPSGQAEAIALGQLSAGRGGVDPNETLEERVCRLVAFVGRRVPGASDPPRVGIVYPTELTSDLGLIALYRRWLEARGMRVALGSPFNLSRRRDGGVALLGEPCDVVIRHYKTDWWDERRPVWLDDAPFPDPGALDGPLAVLLGAACEGRVAVTNPFGAVIAQNKRAMALMWEQRARFSPAAREAIAAYVPYTTRLETQDRARLRDERADWVLKSDYGCEGDEVVLGRFTEPALWDECCAQAAPGRWIAQRYFEPRRDRDGRLCNHGIYLVAGSAAGAYARLSAGPTDEHALSAGVRVVDDA
jgi:hypothetical protein